MSERPLGLGVIGLGMAGAVMVRAAARHPGVVRAVHHPTNLGYGAALRSGFAAAQYELVAFTDGDRQFHVADIGRLAARLSADDAARSVFHSRSARLIGCDGT